MTAAPIPWWRVDLGEDEIAEVARAIRERRVNCGPTCRALEEALEARLGVPHVVATTSGSAALLLAYLACGVAPGDEVVVPASTFVATAHAALLLGASVRLVDVRSDRPLLGAGALEAAIGPRTRAIVAVHLNGAACDLEAIHAVARRRGLPVVEDAAQALASRDAVAPLGTRSDLGAFSMGMTKLLTTGEGGFVATRDAALAERLLRLRNQGVLALANGGFDRFGFNLRLTDLQAALALPQLARLEARIAALERVHAFYREALEELHFVSLLESRPGELPLWALALCAEREKVAAQLEARGIASRPFHPCLGDSPQLRQPGSYPNARFFAEHGIVLPSGPDQPEADLRAVVEALREIAGEIPTRLERPA